MIALFFFFLSISLLVGALSEIGSDIVRSVLEVTANPFVSLFIGLLITALLQSSSTTTSMIVAMVAAGSLEMHKAIPIIMGANIGTTLTSNIVSLNFITKKNEFRRAFTAATMHDQFNILSTIIIFPLQYKYDFLGVISENITSFLSFSENGPSRIAEAGVVFGHQMVTQFIIDFIGNPYIVLVLSLVFLFASVKLLTILIYRIFIGTARLKIENLIFKNWFKSFGWGVALTATIQSSSITTSIVVPLVATAKIKLKNVYPFILGANIGTTITALLAATFNSKEAIAIAVAHLMFNFIGCIIFLLIPGLNRLPVVIANILGELCYKYRVISVIYLIFFFFLLPFAFIYMTK